MASAGTAQSQQPDERWFYRYEWFRNRPQDRDQRETLVMHGIELIRGDLSIRAENAVIHLDEQVFQASLPSGRDTKSGGLPRRGVPVPDSRRAVDESVLRQRLSRFFGPSGSSPNKKPNDLRELDLFRSLYLEGNIVVTQGDLIVARASSIYFSVIDDRVIFNDAELRLRGAAEAGANSLIVIRGKRLVRQGTRTTGRNISITTCPAGKPHFEILTGEVEMIEEPEQLIIKSKSNRLAFSGVSLIPLPSITIRTSEKNNFPLKGLSARYSQAEGWQAKVRLGDDMDAAGQAIHNLFGRPQDAFRGDWDLELGYNQTRGFPMDAGIRYGVDGMYNGKSQYYWLDDGGTNLREIVNNFDGTPITETDRQLFRTENRVHLGESTRIDLELFQAGDPAVYSEFLNEEYLGYKRPETSAYLRHSGDTYLATFGGRWNLADFSYADNRSLEASFVEREPTLSFDWYSEPILNLPGDHPLLVTTSTNIDQLHSKSDSTVTNPINDRTVRLDQDITVSVPLYFGPVNIRPLASGRATYYDNSPTGQEQTRILFESGISFGTRMQRTWKWDDDAGNPTSFRHVLSPTVSFVNRTLAEGDPADYFQFDRIDALDSGANVRVGLLQRFQQRAAQMGKVETSDFFWLDLAQNLKPNSNRDNSGETLGLLEFEAILRPGPSWMPMRNFQLLVEGEHSWLDNRLRTFNTYGLLHAVGIEWFAEYRTDITERGTVGYGINAPIRRRWTIRGESQYNLTLKENNFYGISLTRQDHDWLVKAGLRYDNITGDTSLQLYFEPTLGGLFKRSRRDPFADYGNGAADFTRY